MIYVTADLHGCPLHMLLELLKKAEFDQEDYLFVLGDVIDRGEHGVELLQWMMDQTNVELILGNHEAMLLSCDFLFEEVSEESLEKLGVEKVNLLISWMANGGAPTLTQLRGLLKSEPDLLDGLLDYLRDAPLYDSVEVNDRRFVLVHGGLDNFHEMRPLSSYTAEEILWARPELDTKYYPDRTVIFGHTPTDCFGSEFSGKAVHTDSWICIDTGAGFGNSPMLLRLEDGKEFYI